MLGQRYLDPDDHSGEQQQSEGYEPNVTGDVKEGLLFDVHACKPYRYLAGSQ